MEEIISHLLVLTGLSVGVVVSFEDFRKGRIRNRIILSGFFLGLFLWLTFLFWGSLSLFNFSKILLNASIALVMGYVFWYFDLWAAGDAKLFSLFSFLLPFEFYWKTYLPVFPSFVILINAFVPLVIFVLCQAVFLFFKKTLSFFLAPDLRPRIEHKTKKFFQQIRINYSGYFAPAGALALIFLIFQLVRLESRSFFGGSVWSPPGLFFLMMFLGLVGGRLLKNKKALVGGLVLLTGYLSLRQFSYPGNIFFDILPKSGGTLWLIAGLAVLNWLFSFYEKESRGQNLHFAFWLFLGVCLTLILRGSLLMFR